MTTDHPMSSTPKSVPHKSHAIGVPSTANKSKAPISPAKRWLLISENVYARAQKRGFVGGDPLEDLLAAEKEVDAVYETDIESVLKLTDTAEITEQLKGLFASYGFDRQNIDRLLEGNREAVEHLASLNRQLINNTSGLAVKQTNVLQDVANEAVKTLQSFTEGWIRPEGVFKQAELSMRAIDNALSHLQALTSSVAGIAHRPSRSASSSHINVQGTVIKSHQDKSPAELADAPVDALEGISTTLAKQLREVFSIRTIRDLGTYRPAEWARGAYLLAETNQERTHDDTGDLMGAPIFQAHGITEQQAELLKEAFHITTIKELADNRYFTAARAIVMLADAEN